MTRSKKLFLAAAFVAAGYGAAYLLGAPSVVLSPRLPQSGGTPGAEPSSAAAKPPTAIPYALRGAHLVPDARPAVSAQDNDMAPSSKPLGPRADAALALSEVTAPPPAEAPQPISNFDLPTRTAFGPRARLRDEAPRPLGTQRPAPTTVKVVQQAAPLPVPRLDEADAWPAKNPASDLMPAEYAGDAAARYSATIASATSAAYEATGNAGPAAGTLAPLPFPDFAEERLEERRSHIIVDGDSLVKLAQRYLDDPQRANEIYELNRQVLSGPDLLPIGEELLIPSRTVLGSAAESPQSRLPRATAFHAATRGGLVPIRPVPSGHGLMPRAQLARPLPAE